MKQSIIPFDSEIIKYKIFLIKSWAASLIIIRFRVKGIKKILGATRNCGRWSNIEAVELLEIILGTTMSEKILEFFVTLLGCRIWRTDLIKESLGTH